MAQNAWLVGSPATDVEGFTAFDTGLYCAIVSLRLRCFAIQIDRHLHGRVRVRGEGPTAMKGYKLLPALG